MFGGSSSATKLRSVSSPRSVPEICPSPARVREQIPHRRVAAGGFVLHADSGGSANRRFEIELALFDHRMASVAANVFEMEAMGTRVIGDRQRILTW